MRILSVVHPLLEDYLMSGSTVFCINLGETINKSGNGSVTGYVGSELLKDIVSTKVYVPEVTSKRSSIGQTIKFAKEVFLREGYDVLHINIPQMSVLGHIERELNGIPTVYTQHTATILGRFSLNYKDSARKLSNRSSFEVVCPSNFMRTVWNRYTEMTDGTSVSVIPNGVLQYEGDRRRIVEPKDSDFLLSVGRLEPAKGMLEIVRFCEKFNHKIVVVSAGIESQQQAINSGISGIREYINSFDEVCSNNPDLITRYEYLSNKEIRDLMRKARAYVSFSSIESYGMAVAESQLAGLPLFYLEEGGTNFFKSDGSSVMIPLNAIYRKTQDKRFQIYEDYYNQLNDKLESGEVSSQLVYENSDRLGLGMDRCSQRYLETYQRVKERCSNENR